MERRDPAAFQAAGEALAESYTIMLGIGRLEGVCMVGARLGQVPAAGGQHDEAKALLVRSRDGFRKLGRTGRRRKWRSCCAGLARALSG